MFKSK